MGVRKRREGGERVHCVHKNLFLISRGVAKFLVKMFIHTTTAH